MVTYSNLSSILYGKLSVYQKRFYTNSIYNYSNEHKNLMAKNTRYHIYNIYMDVLGTISLP